MQAVKWGEYRIEDVLDWTHQIEIDPLKIDYLTVESEERYPFYGQATINNGVISYETLTDGVLNNKEGLPTILIHSNNQNIVYVDTPFYLKDGHGATSVLQSSRLNKLNAFFIMSAIRKVIIPKFSYQAKATKIALKNTVILLPQTSNNEIDFEFMESFIRELEEERIRELEEERIRELAAYLKVSGLADSTLSANEKAALQAFDSLDWKEFRLGDLFEKIPTLKLPYKAADLSKEPTEENSLPCLTSSFVNQGLNYYMPKDKAKVLKNVISLPSNSDVYRAYYQSHDFTVLSDAYAIHWNWNDKKISAQQYLFMVTCINQVTNLPIYSYKNKLGGWNVVQHKYISLPVRDGIPDYAIMQNFISAVQKLVIKDVVLYADKKIAATKEAAGGF